MRSLLGEQWFVVRRPTEAIVYREADSVAIASFPPDTTDESIKAAVNFADIAYDLGFSDGRDHQRSQLRRVAGLE